LDAVGENVCDVSGTCADLFESMVLIMSTASIFGSKGSPIPHFNAGLPFWIAATGNMASALVGYYVHVHERFTSRRIRWSLRANLFVVIICVQLMLVAVGVREWYNGSITFGEFLNYMAISIMGQVAP